MSWLLDTDVICQPVKKGDPKVIAWLQQDRCYTSAIVIAQLAYCVRTKEGRQRQALHVWLTRLVDALHGRIHGFNVWHTSRRSRSDCWRRPADACPSRTATLLRRRVGMV